ncbi:HK97 family phage prohead protease [Bradyrhizobium sp. SBR1B]|uniref:HK97 family phage prohead protease n=1 Tax=Bradyrhizobium sp. SBR1B TaxID=2663836 RepID=UPI001606119F|nr:HK97 family phage prohead protease [Bradyrhizobium sp. SBR1B]MBB4375616.1 hypothetical protein [Bradyrhizobium sp. SBR1B]
MTRFAAWIRAESGSIERVTGWPGTYLDDPPSNGRATTPDTKRLKRANSPDFADQVSDRSDVFDGVTMQLSKLKSGPALKYASGLEIEFKASSDGRIAGHGSIFNNIDSYGEKVLPGAFVKSLSQGPLPKMLWQHDPDKPIGKWLTAREDTQGLYVEGLLNLKTTSGRDAYEHLMAGDVDGMSIGYREVKAKNDGNVRVLEELALYEVSVVTFPANRAATVSAVKFIGSKSDLVDFFREGGIAKAKAARAAALAWPAFSTASTEVHHKSATDLADMIDAATAKIRSI